MLPTDSQERKDVPVYAGCLAYFPDAIAEVARLSKVGNDKHNPGAPLHWSRHKSSDHMDCIIRHALEAGTVDDDGFLHDVKIAWRALANLQLALEKQALAEVVKNCQASEREQRERVASEIFDRAYADGNRGHRRGMTVFGASEIFDRAYADDITESEWDHRHLSVEIAKGRIAGKKAVAAAAWQEHIG